MQRLGNRQKITLFTKGCCVKPNLYWPSSARSRISALWCPNGNDKCRNHNFNHSTYGTRFYIYGVKRHRYCSPFLQTYVSVYSSAVVSADKQSFAKWSQLGQALSDHWPRNSEIAQVIRSILVGSAGPPCGRIYPAISLIFSNLNA